MGFDLDALESELLALGRHELSLEKDLQRLRTSGREAAASGDEALSNEIWSLFESSKSALLDVQKAIAGLETRLYAARRRNRS